METLNVALEKKIKQLENLYTKYNSDGFTVYEVFKFMVKCLVQLMRVVEEYKEMPKSQRKMAVLYALKQVYGKYNPDIPGIPEFVEKMLEDMVMDYMLPTVYDVLLEMAEKD